MCSPARVQTREPSGITGAGCDRVRAPPPAVWPPPREGTRRLPVVGRTAWGDRPHHPDAAGSRHRAISSNLPGPAAASAPRRQSRERSRVLGVPAPVSPGLLQGCCAGGVSSCSPRLDRPPREGNAAAGQSSDRRTWGDPIRRPASGLAAGSRHEADSSKFLPEAAWDSLRRQNGEHAWECNWQWPARSSAPPVGT